MVTPFESRPVTIAYTPRDAAELLQEECKGELPVYAIRRKKVSHETAWNGFKRTALRTGLILLRCSSEFTFAQDPEGQTAYLPVSDFPMHLDARPMRSDFARNVIQAHQILRGAYRAVFFEITEQHAENASSPKSPLYNTDGYLPVETEELLNAGCVDSSVLQPEAYCHDGEPGDILVFRIGGALPVAHRFVTTEYPRVSRIIAYVPDATKSI